MALEKKVAFTGFSELKELKKIWRGLIQSVFIFSRRLITKSMNIHAAAVTLFDLFAVF